MNEAIRRVMSAAPQLRKAIIVDETMAAPGGFGYIPAVVIEGEHGFTPLSGNPAQLQSPWVWGPSIEQAKAQAAEYNAQLGLSPADVAEIVASSHGAPTPYEP